MRIKNENYIPFVIGIFLTIKKVVKIRFCTGVAEVAFNPKNYLVVL